MWHGIYVLFQIKWNWEADNIQENYPIYLLIEKNKLFD